MQLLSGRQARRKAERVGPLLSMAVFFVLICFFSGRAKPARPGLARSAMSVNRPGATRLRVGPTAPLAAGAAEC